ncbi:MAG: ORC1-type DNA replication protein [Halobacteriota archaeon]|nr:ORC1-type DNA replication protein [Halobacteriota archaeon]
MKSGTLSDVFGRLLESPQIFKNRDVLRPTYAPEELPHRKDQINAIASILVSALRGETPSNILIYGKTGTGKTVCAKYVGRELEEVGEAKNCPCLVLYLNCEIIDTQYRVLAHLARHFDTNVPMTGWPTDQVYTEFKNAIDEKNRTAVIILDEIDKLVKKGDEILYNLSRINSELNNSKVSIIGITNDLKFIEFLDARVRSSLGEEEIIFPPYDANQLRDILEYRAAMGFKDDVLGDEVIPLCAAFTAQEHGDARRALDLLRVSGEIAERLGAQKVSELHVRMAQDKIELDRIGEVIKTLPTQSKIMLYGMTLLVKNGFIDFTTGDVYSMYKRLCMYIGVDILTQRRITDLISELDMLGIINATIVSKGRYGRTKEISLSVPLDSTMSLLISDYRLKSLGNFIPFVQTRLTSQNRPQW